MSMTNIHIKVDTKNVSRVLTDIQKKQLPFATSKAINITAKKIKEREEHEIRDVFDRPTPYIQRSVFVKFSNKQTLTARVGIKDEGFKAAPPTKILRAEIAGGARRLKKYEKLFRSIGILPEGYYTVPGKGVKLDAYGNIAPSLIVQLISYFRAFPESGYRANATNKSIDRRAKGSKKKAGFTYFVKQINGTLGIWKRSNTGAFTGPVKPLEAIMIFVKSTLYDETYDFKFVAESTAKKVFGDEFEKSLIDAVRSAK